MILTPIRLKVIHSLFATILLLAAGSSTSALEHVGMTIAACSVLGPDGVKVRFRLTNGSKSIISIPDARLPWSADGAIVVAFRGSALVGSPMRRVYMVQDPLAHLTTLSANASIAGELDLKYLYPELSTLDNIDSVVLFWGYRGDGENGKIISSGALTLRGGDVCPSTTKENRDIEH